MARRRSDCVRVIIVYSQFSALIDNSLNLLPQVCLSEGVLFCGAKMHFAKPIYNDNLTNDTAEPFTLYHHPI